MSTWGYGPAVALISPGRDSGGNCVDPHDLDENGDVDTTDNRGTEFYDSGKPDISANGCRIVFESRANNLIAGENILYRQIYLWERNTQQVSLVSRSVDPLTGAADDPGNDHSQSPQISDDGRWAVFVSFARNFASPPDTDSNPEIFVVDLDVTPFVPVKINWGVGTDNDVDSYDASGIPGKTFRGPYISPNGRWISLACNIQEYLKLPNSADNPNFFDTLIHDRDGDGDGLWGEVDDSISLYLHLRDPSISGAEPYANGDTVPFIRFGRTQGPVGHEYMEMIGTTTAFDLQDGMSPADTLDNGNAPCIQSPACGDDIYVRRVWER